MSDTRHDDERKPTGPEPERLKIDQPWEDAVRDALKKKPPHPAKRAAKKASKKKGRGA